MALYSLIFSILLCFCQLSFATEPFKPFSVESLSNIEQRHANQPFILLLWSIDCPPCLKELEILSQYQHSNLSKKLVLVSTDQLDLREELKRFPMMKALHDFEMWQFNADMPERLRYAIDPKWFGELPRAYFYDAQGQREVHSGMLSKPLLDAWLAEQEG